MRVGEAAREFRISADWLRRLERNGHIPPAQRDFNGARRYGPDDVERIRRIVFAGQKTEPEGLTATLEAGAR